MNNWSIMNKGTLMCEAHSVVSFQFHKPAAAIPVFQFPWQPEDGLFHRDRIKCLQVDKAVGTGFYLWHDTNAQAWQNLPTGAWTMKLLVALRAAEGECSRLFSAIFKARSLIVYDCQTGGSAWTEKKSEKSKLTLFPKTPLVLLCAVKMF